MSCNQCDNKPYTVEHILDTDIDDLSSIPDYFIGVRTIEDPSTGTVIATPVRVPGARVMPTGNLANVTAVVMNNSSLDVQEGQVRGGYIDTQPGGNVMRPSDMINPAQFLMLGKYTDTTMLVQTTGFLNMPNGHNYVVGKQYYAGPDGYPTASTEFTNVKLFRPIDEHTLIINGDF